jgi:hypothetical protein
MRTSFGLWSSRYPTSKFRLRAETDALEAERRARRNRRDKLLDLYKGWLDSDTLGRIKQIKEYRDWISHRNPKRAKPAIIDPIAARAILGSVVDQIA